MIGALPLQFFETALKLANGTPVEKWVKPKEDIFRQDTTAPELPKNNSTSSWPFVFETVQRNQAGLRPNVPPQQRALAGVRI